ncbi:MAG: hypothetical protein WC788_06700 [Candidatus Paceibacterota bacterium]|jgi:hypothetical protein
MEQMKTFKGNNVEELDKEVNDWFKEHDRKIKIIHREVTAGPNGLIVSIFFETKQNDADKYKPIKK